MGDRIPRRGDPRCRAPFRNGGRTGRDRWDLDGRYGALHLAALAPGRFCSVAAHSAALFPAASTTAPGAFDDAEDFRSNDIWVATRSGALDDIPVWLDVGDRDGFRPAVERMGALLASRGVAVETHVWPGGHDRAYWGRHMSSYLGFAVEALARCTR